MKKLAAITAGKILAAVSRLFNIGTGSTWPGHTALFLYPQIIADLSSQIKKGVILVAGTNGKTTTSKMIATILKKNNQTVIHNQEGANLLNGIASSLLMKSNFQGEINVDYAIFELDEATLPLLLKQVTPKIVVILNLFRDQLDRYGEVDTIAQKWQTALKELPKSTSLILNSDDPEVAELGKTVRSKVYYFGLNDPQVFLDKMQHAVDSVFCPQCGKRLTYEGITFSHLGIWHCPSCQNKRPKPDIEEWNPYPLEGVYNRYNTLAAVKVTQLLGLSDKQIKEGLQNFHPAFGRQEKMTIEGKTVQIFLSKNPTGFNESIRTLSFFPERKAALLALNDHIPDGRDISWIWDVDFEMLKNENNLIVSGDRAFDLALRLKYAGIKPGNFEVKENLKEAVEKGLEKCNQGETICVLPTYSAMLEVRQIIAGRKLL